MPVRQPVAFGLFWTNGDLREGRKVAPASCESMQSEDRHSWLLPGPRPALFADRSADDLLLVNGAVAGAFFDLFQLSDNIHTFDNFTKNGVFHV